MSEPLNPEPVVSEATPAPEPVVSEEPAFTPLVVEGFDPASDPYQDFADSLAYESVSPMDALRNKRVPEE